MSISSRCAANTKRPTGANSACRRTSRARRSTPEVVRLRGCACLVPPPVDFTMSSPSLVANERSDAIFRLAALLMLRRRYVGPERLLDPRVSPLFGDLVGLPPLLLQAGTREMLRDDAVRFAERARAVGVDDELELWHDRQHCFQALSFLPESGRAIASIARFVLRCTGWSSAMAGKTA